MSGAAKQEPAVERAEASDRSLKRMVRVIAWVVVVVGWLAFGSFVIVTLVLLSWGFVEEWPDSGIGLAIAGALTIGIVFVLALWFWAWSVVGRGDAPNGKLTGSPGETEN